MNKIAIEYNGSIPTIIFKDGKPTCLCCHCETDPCGVGSDDELIYTGFVAGGGPPQAGWTRDRDGGADGKRGSCIRYLCVSVTYDETNDIPAFKTVPCGTTCNNRDMLELVFNETPPEIWKETGQLKVELIFYGWVERVNRGSKVIYLWRSCADDEYTFNIYRKVVNT